MKYYQYILSLMLLGSVSVGFADTVINNYGTGGQPNQQNASPQPAGPTPPPQPYIPAGVYRNTRPDGSTDVTYTTGTKEPFYVTPPNSGTNMMAPEVDVNWPPNQGGSSSSAAPVSQSQPGRR